MVIFAQLFWDLWWELQHFSYYKEVPVNLLASKFVLKSHTEYLQFFKGKFSWTFISFPFIHHNTLINPLCIKWNNQLPHIFFAYPYKKHVAYKFKYSSSIFLIYKIWRVWISSFCLLAIDLDLFVFCKKIFTDDDSTKHSVYLLQGINM